MKKIVSIIVAIMMTLALSVAVFADYTYSFTDTNADGWWENPGLANDAEFVNALKEEGAKLIITIDNADAATSGFQYGFQDTTSWVNILVHSNFAAGEGQLGAESVEVVDGKTVVTVDGAVLVAAAADAGSDLSTWQWVNGASTGNTISLAVKVAAPAAEAPAADEIPAADETPAADEAPAVEPSPAPAADSKPADTGIVLAVLPMAVAAAAVVASKRR